MPGTKVKVGKERISALVSNETLEMWEEITASDRESSSVRYYPSHTLERLIQAEYKLMKAFGPTRKTR